MLIVIFVIFCLRSDILNQFNLCLLICLFSGPGAYNPARRDKHGNMMATKDQRFREGKSDVPGPGAYEVSAHKLKYKVRYSQTCMTDIVLMLFNKFHQCSSATNITQVLTVQ